MRSLLLAFTLFMTQNAFASYLAIGESGEIPEVGDYKLGIAPQLLLNEGGGANVGVFMDAPIREDFSLRGMAGTGQVDFHVGASAKYIPFPDIANQPAMGGRVAIWYAREGDVNITTMQFAPLLSRKVDMENMHLTPYAAIPINVTSMKERNYTGVQFVAGTEWVSKSMPNLLWSGEIAFNLNDSYSALNFSLALPIDESKGFKY